MPIQTQFFTEKIVRRAVGRIETEIFSYPVKGEVLGYEIHMGQTLLGEGVRPLMEIVYGKASDWRPDGVISASGRILGTYLHGLFDEAGFRASFLDALWKSTGKTRPAGSASLPSMKEMRERNYNRLAALLREHLDLSLLPKGAMAV